MLAASSASSALAPYHGAGTIYPGNTFFLPVELFLFTAHLLRLGEFTPRVVSFEILVTQKLFPVTAG